MRLAREAASKWSVGLAVVSAWTFVGSFASAQPVVEKGARIQLATKDEAAAAATWACFSALEHDRLDVALKRCKEALDRDPELALAQLLYAEAGPQDRRAEALARAYTLSTHASPTERLFVDAFRANDEGRSADATSLYDKLVSAAKGEPRAFVARGQWRIRRIGESGPDLDGAIADFRHALELDDKYAAAELALGFALEERGLDKEAAAALEKCAQLAPDEPNPHDALATLALEHGDVLTALMLAKRSLAIDAKFIPAQATLGDALLFSGKSKEARRAYGVLVGNADASVHHEGAMREARSWIFENRLADAERALAAEADLAKKTRHPADEADALTELARLQLDRGAISNAGAALRQAGAALASLDKAEAGGLGVPEFERHRLEAETLQVRAMILAAVGERALAESRVSDVAAGLKLAGDASAAKRARALKGWIAARSGDDRAALEGLAEATRPTLRMALALALERAGKHAEAKEIMAQLGHRMVNDVEGALTRPRALSWLKSAK